MSSPKILVIDIETRPALAYYLRALTLAHFLFKPSAYCLNKAAASVWGLYDQNISINLWAKAINGDPVAQRRMRIYNIGDIKVTEKLYTRIKPYIINHPHLGERAAECGACGSNKTQHRGFRRTKHFKIQRIQCTDCGSWQTGTRSKVGG